MKKFIHFPLLLVCILSACSGGEQKETSENDLDAARNFIRSALDGRWDDARKYMIPDSVNTQILDRYEDRYQHIMNKEDKRGYREASIINYDPRKVNDSVIIFNYANSYMKKKDSLKVVRMHNEWLVDLKYSWFPKADSAKNVQ